MLDNIIGVNEASNIARLSPGTIKNYCASKIILSKKIGKTWVIDKTKLKEWVGMKNIVNTLNNNYKVSGEDEKYATYYEDFKHLKDTLNIEDFEEDFDIKVNELSFPIVVFDSGGTLDGYVFGTDARREDIMEVADDYFTSNNDDGVWEFEGYNVFEESDTLRFEDKEGEVLGYVSINEDENQVEELNLGADPISDGWEDGIGNVIGLDGWGSDE
ncbi:MAG TPA: helix-turn-helix domain-containing protein [Pseudogracilibacillus sp.]|nr:helix-turn-helix domain-containing protein [Pseudogracilibacillus sp.]